MASHRGRPLRVSTPCVGENGDIPHFEASGYSIRGRESQDQNATFGSRSRESVYSAWSGLDERRFASVPNSTSEFKFKNISTPNQNHGNLRFDSNDKTSGLVYSAWSESKDRSRRASYDSNGHDTTTSFEDVYESNDDANTSSKHFTTPDRRCGLSNSSPYFQFKTPSKLQTPSVNGDLRVLNPINEAPRKRPFVTFNDEDILNVYDRECSSDFGIYNDCASSYTENPFSSSLIFESSPSHCDMISANRNITSDHLFKKPGLPVSAQRNTSSNSTKVQQVHSNTFLDSETASKLSSFSQRLKTLTTPATPVKPVIRGGLVTPRTKTPDSRQATTPHSTPMHCSSRPDASSFVALIEGRGTARGEVGIAAICLTNPVLVLCQFSDSNTYPRTMTKLLALNPSHILIPDTGTSGVKLYDDIASRMSLANVVPVQRRHFNESKGIFAINQLLLPELTSVGLQFQNKYYCLAAANSLIKYVEYTENFMFAKKSLKVDYQVSEKSTIIDPATAEHIELINSLGQHKSKLSLLGVLDHCSTVGGTRLLRSNLFQPPVDISVISDRLEVVEEMIDNITFHHNLKSLISRFPDIDTVLSLCVKRSEINLKPGQIDAKIDRMIALKQVLELLSPLSEVLASSSSRFCKEANSLLSKHVKTSTLLLEMMHLVLVEDATVIKGHGAIKFSRALAVKPDVNGLLDIARTTFCEYVEFLETYVADLSEQYQIPLKVQWNSNRGFYIQISKGGPGSVEELPEEFLRVQKSKSGITFVTQEFSVKDRLVKNTLQEISIMSNAVLDELLVEVREYIGFLFKLSETISMLDMLASLATVSMSHNFTKPEFGDSFAIKQGRHPILDTMAVDIVPNDISADPLSRLHILTGPNMSGKSTYLRQVVLLSIMAQVGCYVPAQYAMFRIPDRIFSRVSNRDCIETNSSTFMVEMQEIAFILSNVGPLSLIIIDELGRGTSVLEGASICWAVCEKLLKSQSFIFLATHFYQMTALADLHPCVMNYHFLTKVNDEIVEYTHLLAQGKPTNVEVSYGIDLASKSNLPKEIIQKAREYASSIQKDSIAEVKRDPLDAKCIDLVVKLKQLMRLNMSNEDLATELEILRQQFLLDAQTIQDENMSHDSGT